MNTLVFGAGGYLGQHILKYFDGGIGSRIDIADPAMVAIEFDRYCPEVVINCAGKTGRPNIDWCETHKEETVRSNVTGPLLLLEQCLRRNVSFVHLSSGCLYSGDNNGIGFTEDDPPNFSGSFYVRTKSRVESLLAEFPILILRPRMLFDGSTCERNLILKLVNYDRIITEQNSLTYVPNLLCALRQLIDQRAKGIFNVVNSGTMSPFEIMAEYRRRIAPMHEFSDLTRDDLPQVATTGRSNCVLSIKKLQQRGVQMRDVRQAITEAIESLGRRGFRQSPALAPFRTAD